MKKPFSWDYYSDQPYPIKDKKYKKKMRKASLLYILKTYLVSLFIIPLSILMAPFIKRKKINSSLFFSIGLDHQREPNLSLELVNELDIQRVLLRVKLWELESLEEQKNFLLQLKEKKITLKIMQDRENIEDLNLLENNLRLIFTNLNGLIDIYEIGSTINRTKWGFFSVDEYSKFYTVAYDLKEKEFPHIKLIGSGVIDFEYHFTAHTLFNFYNYHYDALSALLYVDRRGAPENTQLGFSLSDKIALLSTMTWMSPKSEHEVHITETNWPISNTAPYAPTSEVECVSPKLYADYLVRYYLLALSSQQINSVSWHQLIAPGYGLVDNRDGIKIRTAFYAYKFMLQTLKESQFLRLDIKRGYYILQFLVDEKLLQIHWSLKSDILKKESDSQVYDMFGKSINETVLNVGSSPIYIYRG